MKRRETGILGEKLARRFLEDEGYRVLQTNYRCPVGEIDIIARRGEEALVFFEVRTRSGRELGSPEESITPAKMEKLRQVAYHYLQDHDLEAISWRIDVVGVELDRAGRPLRLELTENAVGDS